MGHHHERYDGGGGGYPDGLKEEIPLAVRMVATADAYDPPSSTPLSVHEMQDAIAS